MTYYGSSPLKREHAEDAKVCPRCGIHPLLYRSGTWSVGAGWGTGKMWYECPGCGKRGKKCQSYATAADSWNQQ